MTEADKTEKYKYLQRNVRCRMLWSQALVVSVLMEEMIKEELALQRRSQTINKSDIWLLQVKRNVIMPRIFCSRI